MMIGLNRSGLQPAEPKDEMFHAAANVANRDEYGTLIVDRAGTILSCGEPVERIFGARHAQLVGRRIPEFVDGLFLAGSSPSYSARHLVYLCSDGDWRKFKAMDVQGSRFTLELSLTRVTSDGQEMFLVSVRRAGEH